MRIGTYWRVQKSRYLRKESNRSACMQRPEEPVRWRRPKDRLKEPFRARPAGLSAHRLLQGEH